MVATPNHNNAISSSNEYVIMIVNIIFAKYSKFHFRVMKCRVKVHNNRQAVVM